jgi:hypothetical protein
VLYIKAGEIIALVTARVSPAPRKVPDKTLFTVEKRLFGKATLAPNVFLGKILTVGKFALINAQETFPEFLIVIFCGEENSAHATIQTTRRQQIGIDLHTPPPQPKASLQKQNVASSTKVTHTRNFAHLKDLSRRAHLNGLDSETSPCSFIQNDVGRSEWGTIGDNGREFHVEMVLGSDPLIPCFAL